MAQAQGNWTYESLALMPRQPLKFAIRIALVLCVAWGIHVLARWAMLETASLTTGDHLQLGLILGLLLAYALMIAIPFVPGVELGLSLLVLEGGWVAPWVWLATVIGLSLAFTAGRLVPPDRIGRGLRSVRLLRAAALVDALAPLDTQARIDLLCTRLPGWLGPMVLRYRYGVLAVLINVPGNALIGGGGGIGLITGLSRIYAPGWTVATFFIATCPIPLLFWLYGAPVLSLFG